MVEYLKPSNTPGDIEAALSIVMSGCGHGVRDVGDAHDNHTMPERDVPVSKDASDTTTYSGVLFWPARARATTAAYPGTVFRSLISQKWFHVIVLIGFAER